MAQLRLRGDALADTRAPVGLLVLHGQDRAARWLDAETVAWLGTQNGGDVLTLTVRARHPETGSELRLGRMVATAGAVRPVHIDGARGLLRLFGNTTLEAFTGVPVVTSFGWKDFDWVAAGRVSESVADKVTVGGSYAIRKRAGVTDNEEVGADFSLTPATWLTAAGRAAFDASTKDPVDALGTVSAQKGDLRGELFVTHRVPSRLLPQTSLFSMLGNVPSTTTGTTGRWRAAPRLELIASGSVQTRAGDTGGQGFGRAALALDDARDGELGLEARRVDFGGGRWVGARATARIPLHRSVRLSTELELVRPDEPGTRAALWPWSLLALTYRADLGWEAAAAMEAAGGPERSWVAILARFSYAFEVGAR